MNCRSEEEHGKRRRCGARKRWQAMSCIIHSQTARCSTPPGGRPPSTPPHRPQRKNRWHDTCRPTRRRPTKAKRFAIRGETRASALTQLIPLTPTTCDSATSVSFGLLLKHTLTNFTCTEQRACLSLVYTCTIDTCIAYRLQHDSLILKTSNTEYATFGFKRST